MSEQQESANILDEMTAAAAVEMKMAPILMYCDNCRRPQPARANALSTISYPGGLTVTWLGLACGVCDCLHPATMKVVIHHGSVGEHSEAEVQQNAPEVSRE